VFLFASYALQTSGLRLTTPSKSAFITGLYVALVPLLGAAVYQKAPQLSEWIGIALATAGMALMTLEDVRLRINAGDLMTLGCAFGFAAHILIVGRYAEPGAYKVLGFTQIATSSALGGATFWWLETPRVVWNFEVVLALAVTGILATAVAFTVQAWAQQHTTATRTALIFALEPVFAWLTSFVVAGELLSRRGSAGALLILAGILLVELKPVRGGIHPFKQD
jgi:drug/metabolite transporter (DMT)-like permease